MYDINYKYPAKRGFSPCMAFSVYEVVRVASQLRNSEQTTRQTKDANDLVNVKSHAREKSLFIG